MTRCYYCNAKADYLCDFALESYSVLREPIHDDMTTDEFCDALLRAEPYIKTCDRPLCANHRRQVGTMFIDGDAKHTGIESVDMCPGHVNVPDGFKPEYQPLGGPRVA